MDVDLVIIGSGPGGYVSAIRASQLGMKVALVEKDVLGGVCLNWGCIPTKALLKSGELYEKLSHLGTFGLSASNIGFDFSSVIERSRRVAKELNSGVAFLMKKHKIEVIFGTATLTKSTAAPRVEIALNSGGSRTLQAKHVLIATGARARTLPAIGLEPDGVRVWSYREALVPTACPKSLLVIGSGAIGIEFASFYRALGADVTVIEALDRILPAEDEEISAAAQKAFEVRGIKFCVGAGVEKLRKTETGVSLDIKGGVGSQTLNAEVAIIAIGIVGNTEGLGLEKLGVKIENTHIRVDDHGATGIAALYAIGDVAGPPWLAHKASHEGIHCVEHLAGKTQSVIKAPTPGCTYSNPQIASVGMTEARALAEGLKVKIGRFPFKGNGKAIASGQTEGFIKTLFDAQTGALVGAHLIGAEVTEMVQGFALAMTLEATEAEIHATVFPHPTMSEAMHESALDAFDRVLHM